VTDAAVPVVDLVLRVAAGAALLVMILGGML
jgi:hypothetical protein